jgi:hypothetical protein
MAYAWFICGFKQWFRPNSRICTMNDFTAQINADGGAWSASEILGGYALVKVRANANTLTTIAGTTGFQQRTAIKNKILAMGYTQAEINAVMGSTLALWRQKALRVLFNFIAQRRLEERFDINLQQIVLDGPYISCRSVTVVDAEVQ